METLELPKPQITPPDLAGLRVLSEQGLYLQAYAALEPYLPLTQLTDADSLIFAGRLAMNLGNRELGNYLLLRAYRLHRSHPRAKIAYVRTVLERKGPLVAWNLLQKHGELPGADAESRAEWFSLYGFVVSQFRDFDAADAWFGKAVATAPNDPWIWVERATCLEEADRYEEALSAAQKSLALRPWYRAGVQGVAHALQLLGRDDEAITLLAEAGARLESGVVLVQLLSLQLERQDYAPALQTLDRYLELSPLADTEVRQWAAGIRSDLLYYLGDTAGAIEYARQAREGFFSQIAKSLEQALPEARRVLLPVGYIRQHHMTCAPATLAALSRYWEQPVDHLQIVEDICYDGTPWHNERHWADTHGWIAREFTVTWDTARALLDRGVPFTLTTAGPGYAHMQAVVGYDAFRGTFLIRDPYVRNLNEALVEGMLRWLRSIGPIGMAMVPATQAHLLEGLEFTDSALYDDFYHLSRALVAHKREEAARSLAVMQERAPGHRLVLNARRALAAYDADVSELLACIVELETRYPEDLNLRLAHVSCLQRLSRREERLHLLQTLCTPPQRADKANQENPGAHSDPANESASAGTATFASDLVETIEADEPLTILNPLPHTVDPDGPNEAGEETKSDEAKTDQDENRYYVGVHPLLWQLYAQELAGDAREHDRALQLLRRAVRYQPTDAGNLHILANILWSRQQFQSAYLLYHFAACLEDKNERLATAYFASSRYLKQTEAALQFLHNRFQRLGKRSGMPARTLFGALEELSRMPEAFAVLDQALQWRPEDGELLLFAAEKRGRHNQLALAEQWLRAAEDRSDRKDWLRASARLAEYQGQGARSLELWQEILTSEPLAIDAHEECARLLAATQGTEAVRRHFEGFAARFPHHCALHKRWAQWMRLQEDMKTQERVLRHLVEIDPADALVRRELATLLGRQRRLEEALAQSQLALQLEPTNTYSYHVYGEQCLHLERWEAARAAFRRAIELSVDNDHAIGNLLQSCDTPEQKRAELQFVLRELERQTIFGDGLAAFQRYTRATLAPEELYAALYRILCHRPDLWQAWSTAIQQLIDTDRTGEAEQLALQATARFPLQPTLWQDLATARAARREEAGAEQALHQALQIFPDYSPASQQLALLYRRTNRYDLAKGVLEAALVRDSQNPEIHASLAYTLWQMGDKAAAFEGVKALLQRAPSYGWAWETLVGWGQNLNRKEEALEALRGITHQRSGEARTWLLLARSLDYPELLEERLTALQQAILLNPRAFEARDLRAELLAEQERFDEAVSACRLENGLSTPSVLRGRTAWIEAARGNLQEAVRQMQAVVQDDPQFEWGWQQLVRWNRTLNANAAYAEAARKLVALDPQSAQAFGYLGDALKRLGDRAGAKTAFGRALVLLPDYKFGGNALLEMLIEDGDTAGARHMVDSLLAGTQEGFVHVLGMRLAAHVRDVPGGMEHLRALCLLPGDAEDSLEDAQAVVQEAGWHVQAEPVYAQALEQPNVQPIVGGLWVKTCARRKDWSCEQRLESLRARGEIGVHATAAFLEALANANQTAQIKRFVHLYRESLRAHTRTWGMTAYALLECREYEKVVEWTQDWQQRADVGGWMLLNRAIALRQKEREREANQVSAAAFALSADGCTVRHALWLAYDAALGENTTEAHRRFDPIAGENLSPYYRFLYHVVAAVLHNLDSQDGKSGFAAACRSLAAARKANPAFVKNRLLYRAYRATAQAIGKNSGHAIAPVWSLVQRSLVLPILRLNASAQRTS